MRNVAPADVWDHLAGFAPSNDVGLHDFRETDSGSMLRVKGMDGFAPIGPGIVRGVDVRESTLRTYVDGTVVQEAPVSEMNFGIDYLFADLCRHITLLPGDVVFTGTPANSRPMDIGTVVEVEIDRPRAPHEHSGRDPGAVVRRRPPADGLEAGAGRRARVPSTAACATRRRPARPPRPSRRRRQ